MSDINQKAIAINNKYLYATPEERLKTTLDKQLNNLESLLSITEQFKTRMDGYDYREWQRISAETADMRAMCDTLNHEANCTKQAMNESKHTLIPISLEMQDCVTIDETIAFLQKAKEKVGGDKTLILCLYGSEMQDVNVNTLTLIDEGHGDSQYVQIGVVHPDLS